ncbi:anthranilate synthase component I family protein [Synechococcus sp. RSCCF101]|nr:anthranilate synthase component I family protein [Synechococcus sp. RSCCF101]
MSREALPWRPPEELVPQLAQAFGRDGLSWLDGDGSPLGRRAVVGLRPEETLLCEGLPGSPGARNPFALLAELVGSGERWLAWLAYEAGAWVEPAEHWQSPRLPVLRACRHDALLHFDLAERTLQLEGRPQALRRWREPVRELLETRPVPPPAEPAIPQEAWQWLTPPERFREQVGQLRQLIAAGDLFQANLTACRRAERARPPDPLALYLRLRRRCPAPFSGLMVSGEHAVLSTSMERFLQVSATGQVETRPIKGTRPRAADPIADADAAAELVCSPKDRAENVMIVDLMRHDLGRLCRPGSIRVPQLVGLESYARVHHLTSVVRGELAAGHAAAALLRACWPPGSISGAPKIRACQRLNELEPIARGPYCGSFLLCNGDGSLDSNVLIRSVMVQGRHLQAHAGCGIVADSDPSAEARELEWKLQPLLDALAADA